MAYPKKNTVIIIAGPTASGKSAYALTHNGVVINGDSMQIYDALPILTAHPSIEDQQKIPHKLYGVLSAFDPCSAARWHQMACDEIDACHQQGKLPIVVGGTGLYLDTLVQGLSFVPEIDPQIRTEVRALCQDIGSAALHQELSRLDPEQAARLQPNDQQRVARAYEVLKSTGKSLLYWQQWKDTSRIQHYHIHKILMAPSREKLHQRAEERLDQMLQQGAIEEVARLYAHHPSPHLSVMKAVGVPEIIQYLEKEMCYTQMRTALLHSTRQYIKRQMTWFRKAFADAETII